MSKRRDILFQEELSEKVSQDILRSARLKLADDREKLESKGTFGRRLWLKLSFVAAPIAAVFAWFALVQPRTQITPTPMPEEKLADWKDSEPLYPKMTQKAVLKELKEVKDVELVADLDFYQDLKVLEKWGGKA